MLPNIPKISQLAPGIIRFLGLNPGPYTLQGTNSYLIGLPSAKKRLLIDTSNPDKNDYIELINQYINQNTDNIFHISDILVTHWHPDHVGSIPDIINLAKLLKWPDPKIYKFPSISHPISDFKSLMDKQIIDLSDFGMGSLEIIYTPGHTDDHICLLLKPENILFSGDLILGNGSTTFEELVPYMNSLRVVENISSSLKMILPGHGVEIADPVAKVKEYIEHRLQRINQVKEAVTNDWQSEMDIVVKVYPSDIIKTPALFGALKNQKQALLFLKEENIVECRDCTEIEMKNLIHDSFASMWKLKKKIPAKI